MIPVVVGGLIAAGSTTLGRWLEIKARHGEREAEHERRNWEAKRDAYVRLAELLDTARGALGGGAAVSGGYISSETASRLNSAAGVVQLYAPPEVWERIRPAILAVRYMSNTLLLRDSEMFGERMRELGADSN